jgi:hypothetical protein
MDERNFLRGEELNQDCVKSKATNIIILNIILTIFFPKSSIKVFKAGVKNNYNHNIISHVLIIFVNKEICSNGRG